MGTLLRYSRHHADALLAGREGLINNNTVNDSENGIIFAKADVQAGLNPRTVLANQDVAGNDRFTSIFLHTQAL